MFFQCYQITYLVLLLILANPAGHSIRGQIEIGQGGTISMQFLDL